MCSSDWTEHSGICSLCYTIRAPVVSSYWPHGPKYHCIVGQICPKGQNLTHLVQICRKKLPIQTKVIFVLFWSKKRYQVVGVAPVLYLTAPSDWFRGAEWVTPTTANQKSTSLCHHRLPDLVTWTHGFSSENWVSNWDNVTQDVIESWPTFSPLSHFRPVGDEKLVCCRWIVKVFDRISRIGRRTRCRRGRRSSRSSDRRIRRKY